MVVELAALDFFGLFVSYVFGSFWLAVIGLVFVMFVIMGVLGRVSIWTTMWYCILFVQVMALGYGFVLITTVITLIIFIYFMFSWRGYVETR
jgi:hypothetical protein